MLNSYKQYHYFLKLNDQIKNFIFHVLVHVGFIQSQMSTKMKSLLNIIGLSIIEIAIVIPKLSHYSLKT